MASSLYQRKLYALLQPHNHQWLNQLDCFQDENNRDTNILPELDNWWNASGNPLSQLPNGKQIQEIASSSDRVNLHPNANLSANTCPIRHPISGQAGTVHSLPPPLSLLEAIHHETDAQKVFWWFLALLPRTV
ncbi:MAG: hypothetical protein HC865_16555, partial [Cyanobacteria bacterium RU_5_0]|nr:hypothetical protein [Cyanobacteria bacterium RU_5_0]